MEYSSSDVLLEYLISNNLKTKEEYQMLTEEMKSDALRQIVVKLMEDINDSTKNIDITKIDKTRGEIRQLEFLADLQKSINSLKELYKTDETDSSYRAEKMLDLTIDAIKYLNKYAADYKEAYRLKKSLLILQYESIVTAIIQSVSYLISVSADFKDGYSVRLNSEVDELLKNIPAFNTIKQFVNFSQNNTSRVVYESVDFIRKYYVEYSSDELSTIYEASDILTMVSNGFNSFINSLQSENSSLKNIIYKSAIVLAILFSVRELFFSISNSSASISDSIGNIKSFANIDTLKPTAFNSLRNYNKKNVDETEFMIADTESKITNSNKEIKKEIKPQPVFVSKQSTKKEEKVDNDTENVLSMIGF